MRILILFVLCMPFLAAQQTIGTGSVGIYTPSYQGNLLASGERFDGNQLVAGHSYLPIGTYISVVNPSTRQAVQARIVERVQTAPYVVYLSEAAGRIVAPLVGNMGVYLGKSPITPTTYTPITYTTPISTTPYSTTPTYTPSSNKIIVTQPDRLFGRGLTSFQTHRSEGVTSSGTPYMPNELRAAHRFLPFGTRVKVVNPKNNKSIVVVIDDRGPFLFPNRIIDLTHRGGVELGFEREGVVEMDLYVLDPIPEYYYKLPFNYEAWTIQVASSANELWAKNLARKLGAQAKVVGIEVQGRMMYRVHYGQYYARTQAFLEVENLKHKGFPGAFAKFLFEEHENLIDFRPYGGPAPHH